MPNASRKSGPKLRLGSHHNQPASEVARWYNSYCPESDDLSIQAHILFNRAYMQIANHNEVGSESDFSSGRFNVLRLLDQAGEQGLQMTDVAAGLNISITNLPKLMDDLAERKLIVRVRDPSDGRKRWAQLAPAGRKLLREQVPRAAMSINKAWESLSEGEKAQLVEVLTKLVERLSEQA